MEAIFDTRIKKAVTLHDILHGFRTGMGTGKAIMEIKLTHELVIMDQDLLLLVFLDLWKAYDNLYRGRLLQTLEGYGAGPKCGAFCQSSGCGRGWPPNKWLPWTPV